MTSLSQRLSGFTLIESLVTLAVLAVLLALAAPSMQRLAANQRLRSASQDLVTDLTLARSESLKRGQPVRLSPLASGWESGWSVTADAGATVLGRRPAPGASLQVLMAPGAVDFDGRGFVDGLAGTVRFGLSDGHGEHRCIALDPTGRARASRQPCSP